MKIKNDFLKSIVDDLLIPLELLKCESNKEAIAIVDEKWLFHLTENCNLVACDIPKNITNFQLLAELHHGSTKLNGCTKIHILVKNSFFATNEEMRTPCISNLPSSSGEFYESLADQCFHLNWKGSCLTFSQTYSEENFEKRSFFQSCTETGSSKPKSFEDGEKLLDKTNFLISNVNMWNHVNILPIITSVQFDNRVYVIKKCISHSVYDSLMYSPSIFSASNSKPLFLVFQLIKIFDYLSTNSSKLQIDFLSWKQIALDKLLWIQADVDLNQSGKELKNVDSEPIEQLPNESEEFKTLEKTIDLWVCGKISNFDYLMFLNKLAGRRMYDPNHHPILPWVSNLSAFNGGWRDFTKSKYRLNKGDDQLQLQYGMAAATQFSSHKANVPYHVPDMLSDITYYVYKARVIPKSILQKHVRSYWEPNEYPSTVQRMQEWTPDECIPEFYTDPSIFKSSHDDMSDLGVPDWCQTPQEFVEKHMSMLESDFVSQHLHDWIDITFGYKLSGKHAIQSLNVCRQLVDQHVDPTTQGIVHLFRSPHPHKRLTTLFSPEKILLGLKQNTLSRSHISNRKLDEKGSEVSADSNDVGKDEELGSVEDLTAKNEQKLRFPDNFDPFRNLDQLEKLLTFKVNETDEWTISPELQEVLQTNVKNFSNINREDMLADRRMLVLMCLIVEFYLFSRGDFSENRLLLSERLNRASTFFEANLHQLPTNIKSCLNYLFTSLALPVKRVCEELNKMDKLEEEGKDLPCIKFFKSLNSFGYPSPQPRHLLTEAMQICQFPIYFHSLHSFIGNLLTHTIYYTQPLPKEEYIQVKHDLSVLLGKIHDSREGMEILLPHIKRLLLIDPQYSAHSLTLIFDITAQQLGPDATVKTLLPTILKIYNQLNKEAYLRHCDDEIIKSVVEILYDKYFLVQLLSRLGLSVFLEHFSRPLAECVVTNTSCAVVLDASVQWLLNILGPTLSSKYLLRHMLHVLSTCYFEDEKSSLKSDELVLKFLVHAASLYGTPLVTLQYLSHISYTVSSAIRGTCFSQQSYAALKAATSLLITIVPNISDHVLMEELQRMSKEIIMPLIGVLSSKRLKFPGGGEQRKHLCLRTIDLLQKIAFRIGRDMARKHLTGLLQSFFCNFSIHDDDNDDGDDKYDTELANSSDDFDFQINGAVKLPSSLEPETDTIAAAIQFGEMEDGTKALVESADIYTAASKPLTRHLSVVDSEVAAEIKEELLLTFGPESAYCAYVPFARHMGGLHIDEILKNASLVWRLSSRAPDSVKEQEAPELKSGLPSSLSMVGNQIVVHDNVEASQIQAKKTQGDDDFHLKGHWLAYWEHEIGLAVDDNHIHFNQIDLNSYQGHNSSVRSLYANNTEEWFLSSSKDKTVKIWSLCNSNYEVNTPLFVYQQHKKSIFFSAVLEANFNVVSCDGSLHLWDPYCGKQIKVFDSSDFKSGITTVCPLPAPQQQILVSTTDSTVKMIDVRSNTVAQEYRSIVAANVGIVRSLVSRSSWAAVGFSSGVISFIDIRMGPVLRMWQAHENDIISSVAVGQGNFLTSALDQTIAYWDATSHQPVMVYRAIPEPVHVIRTFNNEVLSATSSNKFIVHSLPNKSSQSDVAVNKAFFDKPSLQTKLRSDILRGALTTFTVLPMKRQLIVASDSGSIKLLA